MRYQAIWHTLILSVLLAGSPAKADPDRKDGKIGNANLEKRLASLGLDLRQYRELQSRQFIGTGLEASAACGVADAYSFNEKFLISDAVVKGRITGVEYLYRQGGPFRTQYTLEVQESLKGSPARQIKILSEFGPNRRDHRRWKRDPSGITLEAGDEGVFFLADKWLKYVAAKSPEKAALVQDKFQFQAGMSGVYLTKSGEFDAEFLKASEKSQGKLRMAESVKAAKDMQSLIGKENPR